MDTNDNVAFGDFVNDLAWRRGGFTNIMLLEVCSDRLIDRANDIKDLAGRRAQHGIYEIYDNKTVLSRVAK